MVRALWKGPTMSAGLMRHVRRLLESGVPQKSAINVRQRACTILPEFMGVRFQVHNGKKWEALEIQEHHIGHKFGEFAMTRRTPNSVFDVSTKKVASKKK